MPSGQDALNAMMRRLGRRTEAQLRTDCLDELNALIDEIENGPFFPFFLEAEDTSLVTVASVRTVALPTDFGLEIEESAFRIKNADGDFKYPNKMSKEEIDGKYLNADPDFPTAYAIFGNDIYLGPTPDVVYTMALPYYKTTGALADDATDDPLWLKHAFNWVCNEAGSSVADLVMQNQKLADRLMLRAVKAKKALWKQHNAREHINKKYVVE